MINISNGTDYIFASRKRQVGGIGQRAYWWARKIPQNVGTIRTPLLDIQKKHSWRFKKVLPAVPSHSPGNFFGDLPDTHNTEYIFQGSMLKSTSNQLSDHISKQKNMLMHSPRVLRFHPRGFAKTAKHRTIQKLQILPSQYLTSQKISKMPSYINEVETIGFVEKPIQPLLRRQNALRGRNQNGFLTSNLHT